MQYCPMDVAGLIRTEKKRSIGYLPRLTKAAYRTHGRDEIFFVKALHGFCEHGSPYGARRHRVDPDAFDAIFKCRCFGQSFYPVFKGLVSWVAQSGLEGVDRRNIHNYASISLRHKLSDFILHAERRSLEVNCLQSVPVFLIQVLEGVTVRPQGRIVDRTIEAAKSVDRKLYHRLHLDSVG